MARSQYRILQAKARREYVKALEDIPVMLEVYDNIPKIIKLWESMGYERSHSRDNSFPIYIYLNLGKYDSMPKAIHLFLEEAVEQKLLPESSFDNINLLSSVYYFTTSHMHIHFDPEQSEHCNVVTKVVVKEVK